MSKKTKKNKIKNEEEIKFWPITFNGKVLN